MKTRKHSWLILLLLSSSPLQAVENFSAGYDLYYNGIFVGRSQRELKNNQNILTYTATSKTAGLAAVFLDVTIRETSRLRLQQQQPRFFDYHYLESNNDKQEKYAITLRDQHTFYNSHTKKTYPYADNLQDTLGFAIRLMHDLQQGKRNIAYTMAEKDQVKTYNLKFIGKESLLTDNAPLETIKLEYHEPGSKLRFTVWCAEKMGFLPVRIASITPHGDENLLLLNAYNRKKIYIDYDLEEELD